MDREFKEIKEIKEFKEFGEFKVGGYLSLNSLTSLSSLISFLGSYFAMLLRNWACAQFGVAIMKETRNPGRYRPNLALYISIRQKVWK